MMRQLLSYFNLSRYRRVSGPYQVKWRGFRCGATLVLLWAVVVLNGTQGYARNSSVARRTPAQIDAALFHIASLDDKPLTKRFAEADRIIALLDESGESPLGDIPTRLGDIANASLEKWFRYPARAKISGCDRQCFRKPPLAPLKTIWKTWRQKHRGSELDAVLTAGRKELEALLAAENVDVAAMGVRFALIFDLPQSSMSAALRRFAGSFAAKAARKKNICTVTITNTGKVPAIAIFVDYEGEAIHDRPMPPTKHGQANVVVPVAQLAVSPSLQDYDLLDVLPPAGSIATKLVCGEDPTFNTVVVTERLRKIQIKGPIAPR